MAAVGDRSRDGQRILGWQPLDGHRKEAPTCLNGSNWGLDVRFRQRSREEDANPVANIARSPTTRVPNPWCFRSMGRHSGAPLLLQFNLGRLSLDARASSARTILCVICRVFL